MGFSDKIKHECLVRSARHCCICHKYKGVKVEVHHIKPKEQGGKDTLDNAIVLCFDCHADAGHYHANHPKGTHLSPAELRKHKENWYKQVAEGKIPQIQEEQELYVRHLLCKNWDIVKDIVEGDFQEIPMPLPQILENDVLRSVKYIIKEENNIQDTNYQGSNFSSKEEILEKYPDAKEINEYEEDYDYTFYKIVRPLNKEDINNSTNFVYKKMLKEGINPSKLGEVLYYISGCGYSEGYYENVIIRNRSLLFLQIENISSRPLKISSIEGQSCNQGKFTPIIYSEALKSPNMLNKLPDIYIKPNQIVLIPQAILLEPLDGYYPESIREDVKRTGETGIGIGHIIDNKDWIDKVEIIGPFNIIENINYKDNMEVDELFPIHQFDFSNLYLMQRHWYCGSCPHIFIKNKSGNKWKYFTETLTGNSKDSLFIHNIELEIDKIRIWEIEDEISYFEQLEIIDRYADIIKSFLPFSLNKGDFIDIDIDNSVKFPITIKSKGYYIPLNQTSTNAEAFQYRSVLIKQALEKLKGSFV